MTKVENAVVKEAVGIVLDHVNHRLVTAWRLGGCLDRLMKEMDVKGDNGRIAAEPAFLLLSKNITKKTGETYSKSTWLHWRRIHLSFSETNLNVLAARFVSPHEAHSAALAYTEKADRQQWVKEIRNGSTHRSYFTNKEAKRRKRNRDGPKDPDNGQNKGIITFTVHGDEDEVTFENMLASVISAAIRCGFNGEALLDRAAKRFKKKG